MAKGTSETRVFGGDAIQAIRTASQAHYHLSAMADRKASMLMGASFVVFSISVAQSAKDSFPPALLVLGATAFLSALCAAVAVMPSIAGGPSLKGQRNLMFFGGFADMTRRNMSRR